MEVLMEVQKDVQVAADVDVGRGKQGTFPSEAPDEKKYPAAVHCPGVRRDAPHTSQELQLRIMTLERLENQQYLTTVGAIGAIGATWSVGRCCYEKSQPFNDLLSAHLMVDDLFLKLLEQVNGDASISSAQQYQAQRDCLGYGGPVIHDRTIQLNCAGTAFQGHRILPENSSE